MTAAPTGAAAMFEPTPLAAAAAPTAEAPLSKRQLRRQQYWEQKKGPGCPCPMLAPSVPHAACPCPAVPLRAPCFRPLMPSIHPSIHPSIYPRPPAFRANPAVWRPAKHRHSICSLRGLDALAIRRRCAGGAIWLCWRSGVAFAVIAHRHDGAVSGAPALGSGQFGMPRRDRE